MTLKIDQKLDGVTLKIKVVPGASRTRIAGQLDDALKIQLATAPEKGKANKELIRFLADLFDLPKNQLTLINGEHNVKKEIFIDNTNPQTLLSKIQPYLS